MLNPGGALPVETQRWVSNYKARAGYSRALLALAHKVDTWSYCAMRDGVWDPMKAVPGGTAWRPKPLPDWEPGNREPGADDGPE
jgi:hypothetical protein